MSLYPDVAEGDWYCEAVAALSEEGVICGFEDGLFRPSEQLTLAQLVKLCYADAVTSVPASDGSWWQPYFEAAMEDGTLTEDRAFAMDQPVDRYATALLLGGMELLPNVETLSVSVDWPSLLREIHDADEIPFDCLEAVSRCYAAGLLSGYEDGCFHGERTLTRAEGAQLVYRLRDASRRTPRYTVTATDAWFEDALILGNSLAGGLAQRQLLTTPDYLSCNGGSVFTYRSAIYVDQHGELGKLEDRLPEKPYRNIILIYGTNEMGTDQKTCKDQFERFISFLQEVQPDARLWLCNVPPVNENLKRSQQFTRRSCVEMNDLLAELAEDHGFPLIDVWVRFADAHKSLPENLTWDGIHLSGEGYALWIDYLKLDVANLQP